MRALCKRCAYIIRSHSRMEMEIVYATTKHKPEKNEGNRFASPKIEEKKLRDRTERWTRIRVLFIVSVRFPKEWKCFCCVDICNDVYSCCFCCNKNDIDQKTRKWQEKIHFWFWENCHNTNRWSKVKVKGESAQQKKLNWYVLASDWTFKFSKNLRGKFHFCRCDAAKFHINITQWAEKLRSRQLFSHKIW